MGRTSKKYKERILKMEIVAIINIIIGLLGLAVEVYPIIRDILRKRVRKEGDTYKEESPTISVHVEEKQQCSKVFKDSATESQKE